MNFKSIGIKTATLAVGAVVASTAVSPAQAAGIRGTLNFTEVGGPLVNSVSATNVDFNNSFGISKVDGSSSGSFASLVGKKITILNDINVANFPGNLDFLSVDSGPLFVLTDLLDAEFRQRDGRGTFEANVRGFFTDGTSSMPVSSRSFFIAVNTVGGGNNRDNIDFSIETVPTPALLPGLIGMGVAALRKRKSEELAAEEA